MKRACLYLRVSTADKQSTQMQRSELEAFCSARGWVVAVIHEDRCSGGRETRPALDLLMADARRRSFDIVLCWKLDRFARSLKHLVNAVAEFDALGIAFVSLRDNVDLTIPSGRLMLHVIGAMAEFERSLIQERVRSGLQQARSNGVRLGRPRSTGKVSRTTLWRRARAQGGACNS